MSKHGTLQTPPEYEVQKQVLLSELSIDHLKIVVCSCFLRAVSCRLGPLRHRFGFEGQGRVLLGSLSRYDLLLCICHMLVFLRHTMIEILESMKMKHLQEQGREQFDIPTTHLNMTLLTLLASATGLPRVWHSQMLALY